RTETGRPRSRAGAAWTSGRRGRRGARGRAACASRITDRDPENANGAATAPFITCRASRLRVRRGRRLAVRRSGGVRRGRRRLGVRTRDQVRDQRELDAAVLRARLGQLRTLEARRVDRRLLGAKAHGDEAILGDALLDEVGLHRLRTALRQLLVVLELGALLRLERDVVRVALDLELEVRELGEHRDRLVEDL